MTNLMVHPYSRSKVAILFFNMILSVSFSAQADSLLAAGSYVVQPKPGSVSFLAVGHPSILKIKGEGHLLSGSAVVKTGKNGSELNGQLEFELSSLDSGIAKRDAHMKERYLEVEKFPKAKLKIESLSMDDKKDGVFKGVLSLHGVNQPIEGHYEKVKSDSVSAEVVADFKFLLTQYGIAIPSFAGVTVADEVAVKANVKFESSKAQ